MNNCPSLKISCHNTIMFSLYKSQTIDVSKWQKVVRTLVSSASHYRLLCLCWLRISERASLGDQWTWIWFLVLLEGKAEGSWRRIRPLWSYWLVSGCSSWRIWIWREQILRSDLRTGNGNDRNTRISFCERPLSVYIISYFGDLYYYQWLCAE